MSDSVFNQPPGFYEQLVNLEREGVGFVLVTLIEALGSTPQDAGAKMLVTATGRHMGTVGGGRVEARAISIAMAATTLLPPTDGSRLLPIATRVSGPFIRRSAGEHPFRLCM